MNTEFEISEPNGAIIHVHFFREDEVQITMWPVDDGDPIVAFFPLDEVRKFARVLEAASRAQ